MRFETDVLTLCELSRYGKRFFRATPNDIYNKACYGELRKRGWVLPEKVGTQITLVFSTVWVAGASRCLVTDLSFAGKRALERSKAPRRGTLWWWPLLVTGPK
jgi:hypothetical protein